VISLFGGVLGIGLGVFFGWAAGELLGTKMPTYELVLPWGRMGLFLAGAALVGVVAALWPACRAPRWVSSRCGRAAASRTCRGPGSSRRGPG
jgi:putative ABC transport system permease protein